MSANRSLAWAAEVSRMKAGRAARDAVREVRLRCTAGLRVGLTLSAWRGRSGRRYVVAVYPAADVGRIDPHEAVVIAVARPPGGPARLLAVREPDPRRALAAWAPAGTDQIHVHRLAETPAARAAMVEDLAPDDPA